MGMARRAESGFHRGRVWRSVTAAVVISVSGIGVLGGAVAHADEPPVVPETEPSVPVETGEVDGVIVAVDTPPVPPTTIEVAVGEPPVPAEPVEVAVAEPPVPPVTVPDAVAPIVPSHDPAPVDEPEVPTSPEIDADAATAIVAEAAASVGAALWSLALQV